ncbi:syntaxin-112-like [Ananas comosus]|uniref:Syntaxin-112-like n=1 Tax=Ananas comosus TaxID=4615 RepID=A0A6P5FFJ9_ANACO|nr:syntaxin-112-like [Ananas comosus]
MNNLMTKSFLDYVELKKQATVIEGSGASPEASADLEAGGLTPAEEANLALFFSEVGAIQSAMDALSALLSDLRLLLHSESCSAHSPKLLSGLCDRVDSDVAAILRTAHSIKAQLEALDDSPRFAAGTSVDCTRVSVTHGIRAKLRNAILSDHKETLKQNYYNATSELASDKVIDEMLKWSGDPMDPPWSSPGAATPSAPASTSPPPRTSSRATSKTPPPTLSPPWLRATSPSPVPLPDSPSPPGSRSPSPATY